jgi:hypothetical protein
MLNHTHMQLQGYLLCPWAIQWIPVELQRLDASIQGRVCHLSVLEILEILGRIYYC